MSRDIYSGLMSPWMSFWEWRNTKAYNKSVKSLTQSYLSISDRVMGGPGYLK